MREITCHVVLIVYCLPFMHICSAIMDMGPGPKAQGPSPAGPRPGGPQLLGSVLGYGPISIMAEHMSIKGNE